MRIIRRSGRAAAAMLLALCLCLGAAGGRAGEEQVTFARLAGLEWSFSSGVGAWSTELHIYEDGSFVGEYHDGEMGETGESFPGGTVYLCDFSGKMSLGQQVDEHSWEIRVDSLELQMEPGQELIEDGVRTVISEPYGLREGDVMRLYLPGTPTEEFTEEMRIWAHLFEMEEAPAELTDWFLYSAENESGFVGWTPEPAQAQGNP